MYGWDRAPCTSCTMANSVFKNIQLQLRGLCDRTGFDTSYMVTNEPITGFVSYIGEKHTTIQYDQRLYQWNMSVANNPDISGVCYSDVSSLLIGKHQWEVRGEIIKDYENQKMDNIVGDYACNSKPYNLSLSLSSCDKSQFTCSGGVCIDMASRCDNINDCDDKSDEADCSRVNIFSTYQKFIVPPPLEDETKTKVIISLSLSQVMDIRYKCMKN